MVAQSNYSQSITIAAVRFNWVDTAKGMGIILVVLGHALGGIIDSGAAGQNTIPRIVFLTIYTFHMPLFFLLSGLFIRKRIKEGSGQFAIKCITNIALPYFIWSVIQYSIIYLSGSIINTPVSEPVFHVAFSIIWSPISQFWFLYVLFWFNISAILIDKIGNLFPILIIAVLMKVAAQTHLVSGIFSTFFDYFIFYIAGVFLSAQNAQSRLLRVFGTIPLIYIYLALLLIFILNIFFLIFILNENGISNLGAAQLATKSQSILTFIGTTSMVLLLSLISNSKLLSNMTFFITLGLNSLPIYVMHVIFVAGTRIFLLKVMRVNELPLLLMICTLTGIIGPIFTFKLLKKLHLNMLFGLR